MRTAAAVLATLIGSALFASARTDPSVPRALDNPPARKSIAELTPTAILSVGKTADWVAITADAVWVGSTGPDAVHRIDPKTNALVATVTLPGEPCAGLASGFGSLWIPLCTAKPSLAKVDLNANRLTAVYPVGPAGAEGGIATGAGSVWMIVDAAGSLARIDPGSGALRQTLHVPAGSYNPHFSDGQLWVTRAEGSELSVVDPATGTVQAGIHTGPHPRFLTVDAGAVWTLNQGDGSVSRVDVRTRQLTAGIALGTPGHGGDIAPSAGMIWTTMPKVPLSVIDAGSNTLLCQWAGPGGDSLGIGHGAIWLTDYHGGTLSRIELKSAVEHCQPHAGT